MDRFVSPICLVLCLAMLVTAFGLMAVGLPEPDMRLHRARVQGNEAYQDVLERDLRNRIWMRRALIGGLFVAAVSLGIAGFRTVAGSD